jgi:hypothetical protein
VTVGWTAAAVAVGLVGWALLLDVRFGAERRLAARWVSGARARDSWAGPFSFLVSFGALAGFGLLVWLGHLLAAVLGGPTWALLVVVPAQLSYVPFVLATAPLSPTGYARWRAELRSAGADAREQRRIAWWAGPPSLLGLGAIAITVFWSFLG